MLNRSKVRRPRNTKTSSPKIALKMKSAELSRSPSPNPRVKLFRTTAEVHAAMDEDKETTTGTETSSTTQSVGELSLLDYVRMLYLLIPTYARADIMENCLLATLNLCLQRGHIQFAAALRDIIHEWQAWKKTRHFVIWKQQDYSLHTFANEFQDTKSCTLLYRFPMKFSSTDCQEVQKLLQSSLEIYATKPIASQNPEPLLSVNTATTTTSSMRVPCQMEAVDARGSTLYDYGVSGIDLRADDGGLKKLFGFQPTIPTTSGISWSISAEVAGEFATFISPPQLGHNVVKLDIYDFKKCVNVDKSNWWKDATVRSVAVTTDPNDPIQRQAEKLADMIATRLLALNPERKTTHTGGKAHTTGFSRFSRNT